MNVTSATIFGYMVPIPAKSRVLAGFSLRFKQRTPLGKHPTAMADSTISIRIIQEQIT
jgi:hypothetical protein